MQKTASALVVVLITAFAPIVEAKNAQKDDHVHLPALTARNKKLQELQAQEALETKSLPTNLISKSPYPIQATTLHYLKNRPPQGDFIELDDGSGWTVAEGERGTAMGWKLPTQDAAGTIYPQTFLEIRPNDASFFFRYKCTYKLYNNESKESVQVNLSQGPKKIAAKRIIYCNHATQQIVLNHNSTWQTASGTSNNAIFQNWRVGDYVILGTNNWYWYNWFGSWSPRIVINVSDNSYVPATNLH